MGESAESRRQFALDLGVLCGLSLAIGIVFVADFAICAANKAVMEIVFILDEGAGLVESADQFKRNWLRIAESLTTQGADCRFAVIPCHPESGQIPSVALTPDLTELECRLTEAVPDSGRPNDPWPDTDCLKALEAALKLDFRDGASPVLFLTTNSIVEDEDRLFQLAAQCRDRGIKVIIQANRADQDVYRSLYENGGQFYTFAGENKTETSESKADENVDFGNLLSTASRGGADEFPQVEKLLVGVKVRGKIALVCDISGSMSRDFPPLVNELRSSFHKDTPLILVVGCRFGEANPENQRPTRLSETGRSQNVFGVDLSNDPHVYFSENTTDAIILAVKQFRRDTVMFNNDLQDGGSMKAIEAFEDLWEKCGFTLSGRSLNCDAPKVLQDFIQKSGGDFKVEPINRSVAPATNWRG